jgi:hypothetical protein
MLWSIVASQSAITNSLEQVWDGSGMNSTILQLVSNNQWLYCAAILTFRLVIVGMAWSWSLPHFELSESPKYFVWIVKTANNILIGVVFSLLLTLFLAEAGVYRPTIEWIAFIAFAVAGLIVGFSLKKKFMSDHLLQSIPGIIIFAIGIAAIMNLPKCGEWIAGGWDPGVYQNQGVNVAESGTFHPSARACYKELTTEEFEAFTRGGTDYRECFTGIPVNPETRKFDHYFFRLTPAFVANIARAGGLRAATRVNYIAGMLVLIMFAAMLIANKCRKAHIFFSIIFLLTQPLWLYHLHIPTTEMLHLFLLCGIGFLLPIRERDSYSILLISLILFLGILNRLSFLPFAAIFVFIVAYLDLGRKDRKCVYWERGSQLAALLAGTLFNTIVCAITLVRLSDVFPKLVMVAFGFAFLAISLDIFGPKTRNLKLVKAVSPYIRFSAIVAAIAALLLFVLYRHSNIIARCWRFLARLLPGIDDTVSQSSAILHHLFAHAGVAVVLVAVIGCMSLFAKRNGTSNTLKGFVLFNLIVLAAIILNSHIASIYPWATRRYFSYLIPTITIAAGYALALLFGLKAKYRLTNRIFVGTLFVAVLASNLTRIRNSLTSTEYNGLSETLARISSRIADDDVVVVDHSWWGTPLTFIYGKQVLNGQYFFERNKEDGARTMEIAMGALERMHKEGRTIRFLTSTKTAALDIYPIKIGENTKLDHTWDASFQKVIHSRGAINYETKTDSHVFRLFTWTME